MFYSVVHEIRTVRRLWHYPSDNALAVLEIRFLREGVERLCYNQVRRNYKQGSLPSYDPLRRGVFSVVNQKKKLALRACAPHCNHVRTLTKIWAPPLKGKARVHTNHKLPPDLLRSTCWCLHSVIAKRRDNCCCARISPHVERVLCFPERKGDFHLRMPTLSSNVRAPRVYISRSIVYDLSTDR